MLTDTPVAAVEPGRLIAADGGAVAFDEALWVTEASGAPWLADTGLPLDGRGLRAGRREPALAGRRCGVRRRRCRDDAGASAREGRRLCGARRTAARRQSAAGARRPPVAPGRAAKARAGADRHRRRQGRRLARAVRGLWTQPVAAQGLDRPALDAANTPNCRSWPRRKTRRARTRCAAAAAPPRCRPRCWRARWRGSPRRRSRRSSLGLGSPDDAALVSFPGAPPLLQTVDFFRAMVDDPYLFGRIAANHALGDIYAMGGLPETALAIATLPPSHPAIMEQDLFHDAERRHRGAGGGRRGADRRTQRRGRRIGARLRGDRAHPARPRAAQGRAASRRPAGPDQAARDRRDPRRRDARARPGPRAIEAAIAAMLQSAGGRVVVPRRRTARPPAPT